MRTHINETSEPALLTHCERNAPLTGDFPAQRASNADKASIDNVTMALQDGYLA